MKPENVSLENGIMKLKTVNIQSGSTKEVQSAVVTTWGHFEQTYGYFEAKIKMAKGQGILNAFWMSYTKKWPPEIDIAELPFSKEGDQHTIYMTEHYDSDNKYVQHTWTDSQDLTGGFHVYGLEWNDQELIWYVDGTVRGRSKRHVENVPMYIELNMHVGNFWSGQPDYSDNTPKYMEVDYVRAWSQS